MWSESFPCAVDNGFLIRLMFLNDTMLNEQDALPRAVIALWKANLEEPKSHQSDPSVIIVDNSISNFLQHFRNLYILNIFSHKFRSRCLISFLKSVFYFYFMSMNSTKRQEAEKKM